MHALIDGWGWLWMTFMMAFWVVLLGAVVYIALRLAQRPPTKPRARS
jgi:ABC-type phosphate/phosphonate transport system permease subunit